MKKCNHHSFILKIKCPYYFVGDCTLDKISCGARDCFLNEKMSESKQLNKKEKTNDKI